MSNYRSRKELTRLEKFKTRKLTILFIANLWLIYFIFLSITYMTNDTFSYFSDQKRINNTFSAAENFCADKEYRNSHPGVCKCKDNSGLGNGSEPCDQNEYQFGDEDNPGHQGEYCPNGNCNDHNNGNGSDKKEGKDNGKPNKGTNVSGEKNENVGTFESGTSITDETGKEFVDETSNTVNP